VHRTFYDRKLRRVRDLSCGGWRIYLEVEIRRVGCERCGLVKQKRLAWLADTPFYTKRFAVAVGRRCRASSLQDVAKEFHLNWKTVKALEMQYLREHRGLLPTREQGGPRLRGGPEQQGPCAPTSCPWVARRGVPAAQSAHMYAASTLEKRKLTHSFGRRA
jgi:hypothetical protein